MMTCEVPDRVSDPVPLDGQRAVVACLSSPEMHGGARVERIDTHASILFLAGDRAWKLKRAVRYDYLDYSTPDRRRVMCEAEFRLGQRLAPQLYQRVVAVNRDARGTLSIGGAGTPVDWLIEMTRFDQDQLLNRLASRGELDIATMPALAHAIAGLHHTAERRSDHGGYAGMAWVIEGNAAAFIGDSSGALNPAVGSRVSASARDMNERLRARLDARRDNGDVRRCHGDLHLGNVVQLTGRPTLFDPVEFNDAVACVDVMYDLAFLLMDLERLSLPDHANALLNAYLGDTSDIGGLAALPLFLSCRAAVRAKTRATAAVLQVTPEWRRSDAASAAGYLDFADRLIHPPGPCVVAIGGYSGSGKSSLARRLASHIGPVPGAVIVRSDEIRKQLFGVSPFVRLEANVYSAEASERVYATLVAQARSVIANQHGVVVDAVHLRSADRHAIEHMASAAGVPFVGLWLNAPEPVLIERIAGRQLDASDATGDVVRAQRREDTGPVSWYRIDASRPAGVMLEDARRIVAIVEGAHACWEQRRCHDLG